MWSSIKMVLWFAMHQFLNVSPKRKVSEKQKLAAKERFQKMWAEKKGISDEQEEELLDEILDSLDDEQVEEDE